jgi:geranylgeranyl pyrophosphate synthase
MREQLMSAVRDYVRRAEPIPPLSVDELAGHCRKVMDADRVDPKYRNFTAVLLNNEVWRSSLAAVPYDRRLLLLPKCLRDERACPAKVDDFGLVCEGCGRCPIHELKTQAEGLGYVVLVAEGIPVVMSLVESGRVEAIVGVSCLTSLERVFPYIEMAAVPGIAIPLLHDGCANTAVDLDWVWDAIRLTSDARAPRTDMDTLRAQAEAWFTPAALDETLGPVRNRTERIARDWLGKSGKRWRPFLAVCAYQALQQQAELPVGLRKVAVAVECFHKASLVHDDIEDQDELRYGQKTLHEQYGVPIALNVGDFLLGEGYRLIAECDASCERKAKMLAAASSGHRNLCIGQGEELCWMRDPRPLSPTEVVDIFRQKTSPAFEVALRLGAIYAGAEDGVWDVLNRYTQALGVAYQIRDDLNDFRTQEDSNDVKAMRPSVLLALAYQQAEGKMRGLLESLWRREVSLEDALPRLQAVLGDHTVQQKACQLLEHHKQEAIRCLSALGNASLKGLLRRVIGRIFQDIESKDWFRELAAGHASGRSTVASRPA